MSLSDKSLTGDANAEARKAIERRADFIMFVEGGGICLRYGCHVAFIGGSEKKIHARMSHELTDSPEKLAYNRI
jgi:hypothetical protein